MTTELIGWSASLVLLATISRQTFLQYRHGRNAPVSRWLFVGQILGSLGFLVYAWLLRNWVFVATNAMLLIAAVIGEWITLRQDRQDAR